ncbi:MAG: AmmeMemoRadiSam system protein A [Deltaproteobacteria bacterium]|nr:AmmeMemoRadiSam system protein A [Deltaproteobacteria bacterium]
MQEAEKNELLRIAREAVQGYLRDKKIPPVTVKWQVLNEKKAAFVTWEQKSAGSDRFQLRGCIGHLAEDKPLVQVVQEMAIRAATGDPRFPPVTQSELAGLRIEISVLSPLRPVKDLSLIRVGEHGLVIEKGRNRGLLLPQVAVREGWDLETFLDTTCLKAGLSPGDWRSKEATLSIFSAEVFHEGEFGR